jgi:hypothetical protein
MEQKGEKRVWCAHCRRELRFGEDVVCVEDGVLGPRGFIDLSQPRFFCDEDCLKDDFDEGHESDKDQLVQSNQSS